MAKTWAEAWCLAVGEVLGESSNRNKMTEVENRQADASIVITPEAFREFELLVRRWMREGWNYEALENGGSGDLSTLSAYCAEWRDRTKPNKEGS